jgi:hypothetical protein
MAIRPTASVPGEVSLRSRQLAPERWEAVKRIFHNALEHPPEERAAYIAGAAKDDPALGDEVRACWPRTDPPARSSTRTPARAG